MTTIEENGLTISQNRANKVASLIRESGVLKGKNSSNAKVIEVYDESCVLQHVFEGDFFSQAKKLGLPERALKTSYNTNSAPIWQSKFGKTRAKNLGMEKYIGWYALNIGTCRNVL